MNDVLAESFSMKRGRKTPLPDVLKKTKTKVQRRRAYKAKLPSKKEPVPEDPSKL